MTREERISIINSIKSLLDVLMAEEHKIPPSGFIPNSDPNSPHTVGTSTYSMYIEEPKAMEAETAPKVLSTEEQLLIAQIDTALEQNEKKFVEGLDDYQKQVYVNRRDSLQKQRAKILR